MSYIFAVTALCLSFAFGMPARTQELISAEGVVVAILRSKGPELRLWDPYSIGDLAEVYMVRVESWSVPHKQNYVLVEYIHRERPIEYKQFDKTLWRFNIHQASSSENSRCVDWPSPDLSFMPTAFGAKAKLPDPIGLTCFLMNRRPVPIRKVSPSPKPAQSSPPPVRN